MEAAKNVAASQVRMTDTSILTQNVTTFIKSSVNFENIFCQGWSPLRISAKLPFSSQPLTLHLSLSHFSPVLPAAFYSPAAGNMPGCLAAWLPGCSAAWLLGCLAAWMLGCLTARLPGCPDAWLLGCPVARLHGCLIAWMLGCLIARMKCAESGIFKIKNRKCHPVQDGQSSFG